MKKIIGMLMCVMVLVLAARVPKASGELVYLENEHVGKTAEDFTLKMLDGQENSMKEFVDGQNAIIFFWATWCPHCREALSNLHKMKDEISKAKIKIVLVDVGEKPEIVNKYITDNKIDMEVFLDEESKVSSVYGLVGLPTFYFVDQKGTVKKVRHSLPEDVIKVFGK